MVSDKPTLKIHNLIAQHDNIITQEIANDSRKISAASKRDSSAMKAIAVLTMCFLPGTFIAIMFTMPLFAWDDGITVSEHFWIYWTVTLPLTAAVLTLWRVWYVVSEAKREDEKRHNWLAEFLGVKSLHFGWKRSAVG